MADGNVLQVIVFALLLGSALVASGDAGKPVRDIVESGAAVMIKLTAIVMEVAPIGVFALIAWVTASQGIGVLAPLAKLVAAVFLAGAFHAIVVYGGLVGLMAKLNPRRFLPA